MNRAIRMGLLVLISFVGASGASLWQADHRAPLTSRSQFISKLKGGGVGGVAIDGSVAYVTDTSGGLSRVVVPDDSSTLTSDLPRRGVKVLIHPK